MFVYEVNLLDNWLVFLEWCYDNHVECRYLGGKRYEVTIHESLTDTFKQLFQNDLV